MSAYVIICLIYIFILSLLRLPVLKILSNLTVVVWHQNISYFIIFSDDYNWIIHVAKGLTFVPTLDNLITFYVKHGRIMIMQSQRMAWRIQICSIRHYVHYHGWIFTPPLQKTNALCNQTNMGRTKVFYTNCLN